MRASRWVAVVAVHGVLSSAARGVALCVQIGCSLRALPLRPEHWARSESLVCVSRGHVAAADLSRMRFRCWVSAAAGDAADYRRRLLTWV